MMISCSHWGLYFDPIEAAVQDFIERNSMTINYLAYLDHYEGGHFDRLIDFDRDVAQT